jgi:hypothetical protein
MRHTFRGRLAALPLLFLPAIVAAPTTGCSKDSSPKAICDRFQKLWTKYEKTKGSVPPDEAFKAPNRAECLKEMQETKKRNAAEYKCVVKCSKHSTYEAAVMCSLKCAFDHLGKHKSNASNRSSGDNGVGCKPDWISATLKPISDKVTGQSFTISLPDKLSRKDVKADGPVPANVTFKRKKGDLCLLSFVVGVDDYAPENAKAFTVMTTGKVLARKDLPKGVLVVVDQPKMGLMEVKVWRKNARGKTLRLTVALWYDDMRKEVGAHRRWMEKVAQTFQAN